MTIVHLAIRESFQIYLLSHTIPASSDLCCYKQDVYITYVIQYYKSKFSSKIIIIVSNINDL
jgi:kynurenine formamidase